MSKTTDNAMNALDTCKFIKNSPTQIEVWNAQIIWTNFRGEANRFGSKKRYFNLVLSEEFAKDLSKEGWNVKQRVVTNENNEPVYTIYYINVTVKADSEKTDVALFTDIVKNGVVKKTRTSLDETTIECLDRIQIRSCDCKVRAWKYDPKEPMTAYLNQLYVIQEPDIEYGGKYDGYGESELSIASDTADFTNVVVEEGN